MYSKGIELPQLRGNFTLANSGRFIGTAGVGRLDLRGLGTDRTLVLINGRRHVSGTEGGYSLTLTKRNQNMFVERNR